LNSNGVLRLYNCNIINNYALNAIIYISACNADYTVFSGTTFTTNGVVTMNQLLAQSTPTLAALNPLYLA
jgi:hypothetical protein